MSDFPREMSQKNDRLYLFSFTATYDGAVGAWHPANLHGEKRNQEF
jgi:hypothetical protein